MTPDPPPADQLLLRGPRLADGRLVDVALADGRIAAVAPAGTLHPDRPGDLVDLSGYLLLPAPAEPHAHHDTALTAAGGPAGPGAVERRVTEAALLQLGHGATAQRGHVTVSDDRGLAALLAALRAGRALRGLAELTTVALPGPLTGRAGADQRARLREAVARGADVVGGAPDLDPDPVGHLMWVLALADEHRLPVDLHTGAADRDWLARLVAVASAGGGWRGLCLGPAGGLGRLAPPALRRLGEGLAAGRVRVVCLPQGGCAPPGAGQPPVRALAAAGVLVAAGGGALRSAAHPVGRGDPLEAAFLLAAAGERAPLAAYNAVGPLARTVLGLPAPGGVVAGGPAELLAVRGDSVAEALSLGYSRLVFHRGRIVARTSAVREFPAGPPGRAAWELPRQQAG
ncbi:hydrolase [Streptomyces sp. DSM 44915]|uniref:Hydrolase n=1 Tax=Streptomyces chisholmiae TaxID=3075540 RepID=A0ABU2JRV6_9ACTN|nr:hydrolase [Streptomyces sp. DSM 44915]MDT0267722.1 hydrolase [Streptomyces sp. DSM 44915]